MRKPKLDCIIAGEANVDLILNGDAPFEFGKEKLAMQMDLVVGGSSSITAFNLASLGTSVGFVGVLGKDAFGRFMEDSLRAAGVDLSALRHSKTEKTGLTIWHTVGGKRAGLTYPGTISMLRSRDVPGSYLQHSRHLHVGAYFLLENLHAGAAALFRRAKKLGLTTSLDCNYDPTEQWDSHIRQVLRYTDVFLPNEIEAMKLTHAVTPEQAAHELGSLVPVVAIKLGAKGAYIHSAEDSFHAPALRSKVVDTTGAGDSFNAGFLSEYVRGSHLKVCARAGISAAARSITAVGGTAAFARSL
ncbi:MAG TPA: sugar kinase [Bryobacteraceae bacterium]|nr:sugar kinase [Bryobacteraceae bacterium]